MKNLYDITKGQLITAWVFGGIADFYLFVQWGDSSEFGLAALFFFFIPFALIFYTIGWRNNKKS